MTEQDEKFKSKKARIRHEDLDGLSKIDEEFVKQKRSVKRKMTRIAVTSVILLLLLSTAFLTARNFEARIEVRTDGVNKFPPADDVRTFQGTISLTNHWYHKYLGGPIVLKGGGRVSRAIFYSEDCLYRDDPHFRWR